VCVGDGVGRVGEKEEVVGRGQGVGEGDGRKGVVEGRRGSRGVGVWCGEV
jgi:hypothetical protein